MSEKPMFEYERRTLDYMNGGLSRYEAEREAIWDMFGDEIRVERRNKKLGITGADESDEADEAHKE